MAWKPEWWSYFLLALTAFLGCLLLNYIVNRINAIQLEERLRVLQMKSPVGQITQVAEPLISMEVGKSGTTMTKSSKENCSELKEINITDDKKTIQKGVELNSKRDEEKPLFVGAIYESDDLNTTSIIDSDLRQNNKNLPHTSHNDNRNVRDETSRDNKDDGIEENSESKQ